MKKILFIVLVAFAATFVACDKEDDNLVSVSVTASEGGTVAGDNGKHNVGTELKFVAIPDNGYSFSCWSDGNQSNPRTVTVQNTDIILVALFAKNSDNNGNNNGGNGQNTNHVEVEEQFSFSDLTVIANADGTIRIYGHIDTNTKIKEFGLYNADGTIAYDFLRDNEQLKEKNNTLDDNGKAFKDKSFALDIMSKSLPVSIYTMSIKTKKSKEFSESIGTDYKFNVGTGANPQLGSQISMVDQKPYKLADFYDTTTGEVNDVASKIEVYLTEDLNLACAKALKVANTTNDVRTQAKADANKAKLADAKVFDTAVITSTNCIATYKLTKIDDATYEISGVMINSKGNYKVDVSAAFAN
ncbi:MAG: hypothetical protein J6T98_12145 [Salinivirgaceae bacterium]|nr:hypothetical protein [Salinivirgaceae bacterium]